jgi:hypothetical protein
MAITILFFFCLLFLYLSIVYFIPLIKDGIQSLVFLLMTSLIPLIDIILWTWLFYLLHK